MPCQARIDAPFALHHIVIRGIEGREIFKDDKDRGDFFERLSGLLAVTMTPCYAWGAGGIVLARKRDDGDVVVHGIVRYPNILQRNVVMKFGIHGGMD